MKNKLTVSPSQRQKLIITNLIDAKLIELEDLRLTLGDDFSMIKQFKEALLECSEVVFIKDL